MLPKCLKLLHSTVSVYCKQAHLLFPAVYLNKVAFYMKESVIVNLTSRVEGYRPFSQQTVTQMLLIRLTMGSVLFKCLKKSWHCDNDQHPETEAVIHLIIYTCVLPTVTYTILKVVFVFNDSIVIFQNESLTC